MQIMQHNGIRLASESFGDPCNPALLLIMGATASMLGWPDELCASLAAQGFFVIRYDHRDTGQSTTMPPGTADYTIEDMASDALAVLDGYGRSHAHIAGMSLGGYIGQMLAVAHGHRVESLTLIASEPLGWDGAPLPHMSQAFLDHFALLSDMDWDDPDALRSFLIESERLCASQTEPFNETRARAYVDRVLARSPQIASMFNHASVGMAGTWDRAFRLIVCRVLVIHGTEDPILPLANGQALADGIKGARFLPLDKVGHELPPHKVDQIAQAIAQQKVIAAVNAPPPVHKL